MNIFILNKQEKVVGILKNGGSGGNSYPFFDDLLTEDLTTGSETFSFNTFLNPGISEHLIIGNYVSFQKDGKYKLFQIMQTEEVHDEFLTINIYCESASLSLINHAFRGRKLVSADARSFLENVLEDTSWNVGFVEFGMQDSIDLDLETGSVYAILQNNASKYAGELEFRVEINKGRISNKFVDIYSHRGRASGKRFEFSKDIQKLSRNVDSSELYTALIGKGKDGLSFKDVIVDGIDKPYEQDFVADQQAYEQYNHNGYHLMGIYECDTENPEELLRRTYEKLQEVKEPKITYEVDVELLNNDVQIGDTIGVIDAFFNPPILLQARVSKLETSFTDSDSNKCTLTNFVEANTNINKELLSQLEGFVNTTIGDKFPIKEDDISNGAVTSEKIYQNSIATDHLKADIIEANHIKADQIQAKHIQANTITANEIQANTITSNEIATNTITADSAIIANGAITTAQIADASITNAKIGTLAVGEANIQDASITNAKISNLSADKITAGSIDAERLTANIIEAINMNVSGKITADKIDVGSLTVDEIDAGKITSGTIDTGRLTASVINAINASIENATIDSAKIGELSADKITSGTIQTDILKANIIEAINLSVGKISADHVDVGTINVGEILADQITSNTIDVEKLTSAIIQAINMSAGKISAQNIDVENIQIGNANIVDASISGAKIESASISNAQIANATIESAKIKEIYASKIKSGTVETGELDISSIDGTFNIKGNTLQIKDNQTKPVTRVQIGKDAVGSYGIVVTNANGKAIFDSSKGVLNPEGLADDVISEDKIVDGAVGVNKLNLQELFVEDSAFINNLHAVKIDATQISTGLISNERIDITGLVSFNSFDEATKNLLFDTSGDVTYINGGMIATNSIKAEKIDLKGLTVYGLDNRRTFAIAQDGTVTIDAILKSDNFENAQGSERGYQITTDGKAIFNDAEIRGNVILPNAGITDSGSLSSSVRFWAGSSFENRENAPFRVNQDGSVFATNGTYEGLLRGKLDSGDVQIYENAITIHRANTEDEIIRLDASKAMFDVDFSLGGDKILFSNGDNNLKLEKTNIQWNSNTGGQSNFAFIPENGEFNGLNIIGLTGGRQVIRHSTASDKQGTLIFDSEGNQGQIGDFSFTRKNHKEDVKVDVDGELVVKTKIKGKSNNMEMRTTSDGFAFFAI